MVMLYELSDLGFRLFIQQVVQTNNKEEYRVMMSACDMATLDTGQYCQLRLIDWDMS